MKTFNESAVRQALARSWSKDSARQWTPKNPATGQCSVTAAAIHDIFGGEILRTKLPEGYHYYSRINGRVVDLTDSQFAQPISRSDEISSREAALEGISASEFQALRSALLQNLK